MSTFYAVCGVVFFSLEKGRVALMVSIALDVRKLLQHESEEQLEGVIRTVRDILWERNRALSVYEPTGDPERDGPRFAKVREMNLLLEKFKHF
jgi:hypothetical protein